MRRMLAFALLTFAASPAFAAECDYPQRSSIYVKGEPQYRFTNECGQDYEVGYRVMGTTLYFPTGGTHSLPKATEEEALKIFREAYGLVGEDGNLIRTKW